MSRQPASRLSNAPRAPLAAALLAALAAALAAMPPSAAARQDPPAGVPQTFRAGVDLVTVDVSVRDGNAPVAGLTSADFRLRDNGVIQTVDAAELSSLPIDVTIAIDTSGSMLGDIDGVVAQARAAAGLMGDGDRLRLVTFAWDVRAGTFRTAEGADAIGHLTARGATALRDGLAISLMHPRIDDRRHLVILYTDGDDNYSALSGDDLLMVSRRTDSVLHVLQVVITAPIFPVSQRPSPDWRLDTRRRWYPPASPDGNWSLGEVARNTGGDIEHIGVRADSAARIAGIIQRFRESYVLRYRVAGVPLPGWHAIDVQVPGTRYTIRARRGYFVTGPAR